MNSKLAEILKRGNNAPYRLPIKVKVCGISEKHEYTVESGEKKGMITVGLCDASQSVKGVLYDMGKADLFTVGQSIMIINCIVKRDPISQLVITKNTKVMKTSSFETNPEIEEEAKRYACPPPAPEATLNKVSTSPLKTLLTIKGQITSEQMARTVDVRGKDVQVKDIMLKDHTGSCKISLWRNLAKEETSVGTVVSISNVVVQEYNKEKTVSTTSRSKLEEVEMPPITQNVLIIAYHNHEDEDDQVLLMAEDDDYPSYIIKRSILADYYDCEPDDVDMNLENTIPIQFSATINNQEITAISLVK